MNVFFDISTDQDILDTDLQLKNLGSKRIFAMIGKSRGSDFWGNRTTDTSTHYTSVIPEDYDYQFASKISRWKPVYDLEKLLQHHYLHYEGKKKNDPENFLKHIRYVILPKLKRRENSEVVIELVEKWLLSKEVKEIEEKGRHIVNNNTIKVGNVYAPIQFQQNSSNSTQVQNNHLQKEDIKAAFDLLSHDIQKVNEQIRADFSLEMDYAIKALGKDKDISPQLTNIGLLMKEVGMGIFTNLMASPVYELLKPKLGL